MAKIVALEYPDSLNLNVQCQVETAEYNEFSQRVTEQYLKNVEVKGFRKGKAPKDLALKQIDPIKLNQIVLEEAVQRFYKEVQPEVTTKLKAEDRIPVNIPARVDPESVKLEDDGFKFTVIIALLPKIELKQLENLELEDVSLDEAGERLTFEEFKERESEKIIISLNDFEKVEEKAKKGYQLITDIVETVADSGNSSTVPDTKIILGGSQFPPEFEEHLLGTQAGDEREFSLNLPHGDHAHDYEFKVTVKEILKPKYSKLEDIFANVESAKQQFPDIEAFEKFLHSIYDQETETILTTLRRRHLIRQIIELVPDFDLPTEQIEAEVNRIVGELKHRAEHAGQSLEEVFANSGLPEADKKLKKEEEIKKAVNDYVYKEFKLVEILRAIYQIKVEDKIKEEEIKKAAEEMKKDPQKYNVTASDLEDFNRLQDLAYDRLLRNKSYMWVYDRAKFVTKSSGDKKSSTKKPASNKKEAKTGKKKSLVYSSNQHPSFG